MTHTHATLAAALPVGDWQFWVVTLALLGALFYLLRPAIKKMRGQKGTSTKATLTVGGKAMDRSSTDGQNTKGV